jgi:hypothetical protein
VIALTSVSPIADCASKSPSVHATSHTTVDSVSDDASTVSLPCAASVMSISQDQHRTVTEAWVDWTNSGKQSFRGVDPNNPDTDPSNLRDGANGDEPTTSHNRVHIMEMLDTTFTNVQDYTDPPEVAASSDHAGNVTPPPTPSPLRKPFASFKEIALHHNLCQKQYYAFLLLGTVLLNYLMIVTFGQDIVDAACNNPDPTATQEDLPVSDLHRVMKVIMHLLGTEHDSNKIQQLVMFFGGEAGSGKTEVTKAVTTLAELWGLSDVFHKTATTGSAANLIDGCTIHRLASLMSKLDNIVFIPGFIIQLLLLDEVSMFQRALNGFLNQTLQNLLDRPGKLLGGIGGTSPHCIFFGLLRF